METEKHTDKPRNRNKTSTQTTIGSHTPRTSSPVPSGVSMKSDCSRKSSPSFGSEPEPSGPHSHTPRPLSPVPSGVSMKSDCSRKSSPSFGSEPEPSGPHVLRSSDPQPPLDDDGHTDMAESSRHLQTEHTPHTRRTQDDEVLRRVKEILTRQFQIQQNQRHKIPRPPSPVPSCVSLKSDRSMPIGPDFSSEPAVIPQIPRPPSPVPSCVSLKSERSMPIGPDLTNEQDPSAVKMLKSLDPQPPLDDDGHTDMAESSRHLQTDHTPHSRRTQDDVVLRRVIENHKASLKRRFKIISEGIMKSGDETLLNKIYTELYITEGESEGVNTEHEVWQVESASKRQNTEETPINYNDIFKPLPGQEKRIRTVMTKGVAGIGKSVSVQKFILDWTDGEANKNVDFMIPLSFRELNLVKDDQYSLHKLLLDFHPELKELNDDGYKDCQVVFIFDGLDESQLTLNFEQDIISDVEQTSSVDVLATNLIQRTLLPSALIWITSRPAASSQIPAQYIDQVTEVRGFNDPEKEEYFRKRITDENKANRVIKHIKASRSLHIMCHIPVFCWITATVLQEMLGKEKVKDIPKTLTEMFVHFLLIQTTRKDQKYQSGTVTHTDKLLESQKDILLKMAQLAFNNLEKGSLMFYQEDLSKCGIDVSEASVYSGMCTEIFKEESVFQKRKVYSFVHLSIQEFLAAVFVFHSYVTGKLEPLKSLLSKKQHNKSIFSSLQTRLGWKTEVHVLLKSAVDEALKSRNGHLDLFLRFLMGISLESNQSLMQGLLNQVYNTLESIEETCRYMKKLNSEDLSPERCINLLHCLSELNDHSMHEEIQKFLSSKNFKQKLSPAHCSALAHMFLMSEEVLDEFDLNKYNTSDEGRRRLIPVVRCCRKARLADCKISAKSCEIVATVLQSSMEHLIELDLSHNDLGDSGVHVLSKGLTSPNCKLPRLRLSGCLISEKGCTFLASALTSNPSCLEELDVINNHLGEPGLKLLSVKLKDPVSKLEMLKTDQGVLVRTRACLLRYACKLTLDPNTAFSKLSLSEGNRKVTCVDEWQPYPDHPERFDSWSQVLCREGLSGRCYWEAEWSRVDGAYIIIAVAYKSTERKGGSDDVLVGRNAKSWSLTCSPHSYFFKHNNKSTAIPAPSSGSRRVGVYLDWLAGTLSFYSVSSDTLTHLHTFHSTFTEPLYPGVWVWSTGSSVSLCQIT